MVHDILDNCSLDIVKNRRTIGTNINGDRAKSTYLACRSYKSHTQNYRLLVLRRRRPSIVIYVIKNYDAIFKSRITQNKLLIQSIYFRYHKSLAINNTGRPRIIFVLMLSKCTNRLNIVRLPQSWCEIVEFLKERFEK